MDMRKYTEFGGGDMSNNYCVHCTDAKGNLRSVEEVKEKMTKYYLKSGMCAEEAERRAKLAMSEAPAWRKK